MSNPSEGAKERRGGDRYIASWRVAVFIEGLGLHYGRLKDISLHGAAILGDLNLDPGVPVLLNIYIPPLTRSKPRILKIRGVTVYASHDSDHRCFRVGIDFWGFEAAADRTYLEGRLANQPVAGTNQGGNKKTA